MLEDEPSHSDHARGVAAAFGERVARRTAYERWHGQGDQQQAPITTNITHS